MSDRFVQRTCIGCFKTKVDVRSGVRAFGDDLKCEKCKSGRARQKPVDKQAAADAEERREYVYTWGR